MSVNREAHYNQKIESLQKGVSAYKKIIEDHIKEGRDWDRFIIPLGVTHKKLHEACIDRDLACGPPYKYLNKAWGFDKDYTLRGS